MNPKKKTKPIVARVEVVDRQYWPWWGLIAKNGEILGHSENYSSLWSAKRTACRIADQLGVPLVIKK